MGISDSPTIIAPEQSLSKSGNLLYSEEEVDYSPLIPRGGKEESFEFESWKKIERREEILGELKAPEISFISEKIGEKESFYSEMLSEKSKKTREKEIRPRKSDIVFSREIVNVSDLNLYLYYFSRLVELDIAGYNPFDIIKDPKVLKTNPEEIKSDLEKLDNTIKARMLGSTKEHFVSVIAKSMSESIFRGLKETYGDTVLAEKMLDEEKKEYDEEMRNIIMRAYKSSLHK